MAHLPSVIQANRVTAPTQTLSTTVGTAGTVFVVDLSSYRGSFVRFRSAFQWHPRAAASSGTATAGEIAHEADKDYDYLVTHDTQYLAVYPAATGSFQWAVVSR